MLCFSCVLALITKTFFGTSQVDSSGHPLNTFVLITIFNMKTSSIIGHLTCFFSNKTCLNSMHCQQRSITLIANLTIGCIVDQMKNVLEEFQQLNLQQNSYNRIRTTILKLQFGQNFLNPNKSSNPQNTSLHYLIAIQ